MMSTKHRNFRPLPDDILLEELVPEGNFYRCLENGLELSFVRELVGDLYAHSGCPSVDPEVVFKLADGSMRDAAVRRDPRVDPGRIQAQTVPGSGGELDYYRRNDRKLYLARVLKSSANMHEAQGHTAQAERELAETRRLIDELSSSPVPSLDSLPLVPEEPQPARPADDP